MTIRYLSRQEDAHRAFYRTVTRQQRLYGAWWKQWAWASMVGVSAPLLHYLIEGSLGLPLLDSALFAVVVTIGFWAFLRVAPKFCYRLAFRRLLKQGFYLSMLGDLEVSLTDEGVSETYPNGSISTAWAGVESVEIDAEDLLIRLSSQSFHQIPLSAFPTPQDASAFEAYARERIQAAKAA